MLEQEKLQCKLCDKQLHLYHTPVLILVEEAWYNEMGKECFMEACLLYRD